MKPDLGLLFVFIVTAVLILTYVIGKTMSYLGKVVIEKWIDELHDLKKGDLIYISHKDYDKEAIFVCKIIEKAALRVRPFKNGVLHDDIIISNDQFIKLINEKDKKKIREAKY